MQATISSPAGSPTASTGSAESDPTHVYFALLPGSLVLDWAGPAEALRIANQALVAQGQPARFVLHFVSPTPESVTSVGAVDRKSVV